MEICDYSGHSWQIGKWTNKAYPKRLGAFVMAKSLDSMKDHWLGARPDGDRARGSASKSGFSARTRGFPFCANSQGNARGDFSIRVCPQMNLR